jgi:CII-binding regulator of phage lambda lysogenization HflD
MDLCQFIGLEQYINNANYSNVDGEKDDYPKKMFSLMTLKEKHISKEDLARELFYDIQNIYKDKING